MVKKIVTIDELIDLAIGTPECAVNFLILQKLLKIIAKRCCKFNCKFLLDMDDMRAEITKVGRDSQSFSGGSQGSLTSDAYSSHSVNTRESKSGGDNESEVEEENIEKEDQERSAGSKIENEKESESSNKMASEKDIKEDERKEKDESKAKPTEKSRKRKSSEHLKQKNSESSKKRESDNTKNRMRALEDFNKKSENKTGELENQLKEMTDRIESITQTISKQLGENHLMQINEEIEKLRKNMENTMDQCYEVNNTINDQCTQINDILTTINNIQLRKVENEELIDLLSGKADHSFVSEKVSSNQFEETIQELKDVINESTMTIDSARLETNASLDAIKDELNTKLLAEEFDIAKTKIYKELIKLTQQHELILAQQNEHVAAGAKMRNLNCFVCNSDVVMLLEQETIPKFRDLKVSLQPLEPIVGSKIVIGKNTPEWKSHQLKIKEFTKASKASRFKSGCGFEKSTYVKGKNGCMYRGNVGCDCVEGMNAVAVTKEGKCCDVVEAKHLKDISQTNGISHNSNIICKDEIGNVVSHTNSANSQEDRNNLVNEEVPKLQEEETEKFQENDESYPDVAISTADKINVTSEDNCNTETESPIDEIFEAQNESNPVIDNGVPIETINVIADNNVEVNGP